MFYSTEKKKIHLPALDFFMQKLRMVSHPPEKKGSAQSTCPIYGTHLIQPLNPGKKAMVKLSS